MKHEIVIGDEIEIPSRRMSLERMSYSDLIALQSEIKERIESFRDKEARRLRDEIESLARNAGFSVRELFPTSSAAKFKQLPPTTPRKPIKYVNPENRFQTWSGYGKRPRWLKEKIAAGADADDFRIAPK